MRYLYALIVGLVILAAAGHFAAPWWLTLGLLIADAWIFLNRKPKSA